MDVWIANIVVFVLCIVYYLYLRTQGSDRSLPFIYKVRDTWSDINLQTRLKKRGPKYIDDLALGTNHIFHTLKYKSTLYSLYNHDMYFFDPFVHIGSFCVCLQLIMGIQAFASNTFGASTVNLIIVFVVTNLMIPMFIFTFRTCWYKAGGDEPNQLEINEGTVDLMDDNAGKVNKIAEIVTLVERVRYIGVPIENRPVLPAMASSNTYRRAFKNYVDTVLSGVDEALLMNIYKNINVKHEFSKVYGYLLPVSEILANEVKITYQMFLDAIEIEEKQELKKLTPEQAVELGLISTSTKQSSKSEGGSYYSESYYSSYGTENDHSTQKSSSYDMSSLEEGFEWKLETIEKTCLNIRMFQQGKAPQIFVDGNVVDVNAYSENNEVSWAQKKELYQAAIQKITKNTFPWSENVWWFCFIVAIAIIISSTVLTYLFVNNSTLWVGLVFSSCAFMFIIVEPFYVYLTIVAFPLFYDWVKRTSCGLAGCCGCLYCSCCKYYELCACCTCCEPPKAYIMDLNRSSPSLKNWNDCIKVLNEQLKKNQKSRSRKMVPSLYQEKKLVRTLIKKQVEVFKPAADESGLSDGVQVESDAYEYVMEKDDSKVQLSTSVKVDQSEDGIKSPVINAAVNKINTNQRFLESLKYAVEDEDKIVITSHGGDTEQEKIKLVNKKRLFKKSKVYANLLAKRPELLSPQYIEDDQAELRNEAKKFAKEKQVRLGYSTFVKKRATSESDDGSQNLEDIEEQRKKVVQKIGDIRRKVKKPRYRIPNAIKNFRQQLEEDN